MTGPKGNSEFCFPRSKFQVNKNQKSLFSEGNLLYSFVRRGKNTV